MKTKINKGLILVLALLLSLAGTAGSAVAAPAAASLADGPNLLQNPGFEAPFNKQCCRTDLPPDKPPMVIDEIQVAQGWSGWWLEPGDAAHPPTGNPAWHRPEYRNANCQFPVCANRFRSGSDAQKYFTFFSVHDAGVYQQVSGITPGSLLQFSIYMEGWSTPENVGPSLNTQNMGMRIGIDPYGGTNAFSPNVIWSASNTTLDFWAQYTIQAVAKAGTVTVFTRSAPFYGFQHNDIYLDDASLVVVGAGSGSTTGTGGSTPLNNPAPVTPPGSYVIQPGDILTRIAYRFGTTVEAIVAANHLANANLVSVGQVLIIPGGTGSSGSGSPAPTAPAPGPLTGPIEYEVVAGDSLWRLSDVYGVSIARIKQLNNLKSDTIYIGQILTIAP